VGDAGDSRSGMVTLVGRPNVGKSTLLNAMVGQKISITTPKPQTTRHRIVGISTRGSCQTVLVDTPGLHRGGGRALNRQLNRSASSSLRDVDLVLMVVQALVWSNEDEHVLGLIRAAGTPFVIVVNKCDSVSDKTRLLPYLASLQQRTGCDELWPVSALTGDGVEQLQDALCKRWPIRESFYPGDQVTDRSERFLVGEIVREKLTLRLGEELPYRLSVSVEQFEDTPTAARIGVVIVVEKASQKRIAIGKGGSMLKAVGSAARHDIETLLERPVFLQLWVKVQDDWSNSDAALRRLGYSD